MKEMQVKEDQALRHVCYLFSPVWLFGTLWTVACQAALSMGFSRQEYWSELLCPLPGDLPDAEIELMCLMSPVLPGRFFTTSVTWEAQGSNQGLLHWEHGVLATWPSGKALKII